MGYQNVAKAYTYWTSHLHHAPFRLLVFMAMQSKDEDTPPRYYGGMDALSNALGRGEVTSHADVVAVSSAVSTLVKSGALTYKIRPARGRRAEYYLHLDGPELLRLNLTTTQAQPEISQAQPDVSQAQPVPNRETENKNRRRDNSSSVPVSLVVVREPVDKSDLIPCPSCRWLAWEGHQPGCRKAVSA